MGLFDGIGGDLISGGISGVGQAIANDQNRKEARKNRAFQLHMSSTAYQRAMADMKAAGLNPMLAYKMGGASTGSGAQAQLENVGEKVTNSALAARELKKNIEATNSIIELNKAQTAASQAKAALDRTSAKAIDADLPKKKAHSQIWEAIGGGIQSAKEASEKFKGKSWQETVPSYQKSIELKSGRK